MTRTILHVDLDAFFCSVEENLNPALRGKAFVVAGDAHRRGVVSSASYAARPFGVRSAMPTARALRLCPGLIVVPPRHGVYGRESDRVMDILHDAAPLVEQISVDEAFLDVSDDPRPGEAVARQLREAIDATCRLPTSWGVAPNKLVAKIATEVGKPGGLVVVPAGSQAAFLSPLPVEMLWGVGPRTRQQLASLGVKTIGDLAAAPEAALEAELGAHGTELAARARGEDDRPVEEGREARSMSSETTFADDIGEAADLLGTLHALSDEVGARLREAGMAGATVRLKVRWPDFTTLTRQVRLPQPTDQDGEIYGAARGLFEKVWTPGRKIRLLGVGVSQLGDRIRQLGLFDAAWQTDQRLLAALDAIRARYGHEAVRRGARRGRGDGTEG
jgi:DNA polymerase-4